MSWYLRRHPRVFIGGGLVAFLILVAIFAPFIARYDPTLVNVSQSLEPPSADHWFGTDDLGRDVFSRTVYGSRISLSVGLIAVGIGFFTGVTIGLVAGYVGGLVDLLAMRAIDALLAFPALILAISITALAVRERDFVLAARTIGAAPRRIVLRHIFPNITNPLVVQATLSIAFAILAEATLSFLGLGAQPPTPTWGADINYSQRWLSNLKWWMSVGPGLGIFLAVFAFNYFGDALRDALDPRLRRSGT